MRREHLLRLYPRAWRERYGVEFLATIEHGPLRSREAIDIVFGAIDAWLSADVRRMTMSPAATREGGRMLLKSLWACERTEGAVTPRDGLIGAAVMLVSSVVFKALAHASQDAFPAASHLFTSLAFLGPFTLSMPFWLMRGQSWRAQTLIVGGTLTLLVLIG